MDNLIAKDLGPVWLNDKLFVIDGRPLKFHLHGYDESVCRAMTKIIEAFGGKLSGPDDPDTFVFSEEGRLFLAEEGDRYNIKYFYDSIVALEPKELISYKLEGLTDQHMACSMDVGNSNLSVDIGEDSDDSDSMERLHITSDEDETGSSVNVHQTSHFKTEEGNTDESPKMIIQQPPVTTNQEPADPVDNNRSACLHNREENHNFDGETGTAESSSDTAPQNGLAGNGNSCTASRKRVHNSTQEGSVRVKRSVKNVMERANTHSKNGDRRNDDNNGVEGEKCVSSSGEDGDSEDSWDPRTDGDSDESEADVDDFIPPSGRRSSKGQIAKTPRTAKSTLNGRQNQRKNHLKGDSTREKPAKTKKNTPESKPKKMHWTEEENRVLIQYLINNDVICQPKGDKFWSECLETCKSSLHPARTATSLNGHFRDKLRYNYTKYTDDPEALEKFRKLEIAERKNSIPWTEKESGAVMEYLINNDVIHRARGPKVWSECLEACKSSLHQTRTVESLKGYFRHKLRHNYAQHTDDPEAVRKFQGIEVDQKSTSWTEKENRVLIQYLIDQDVIYQARSNTVWIKCLEECKSSLHPARTALGLRGHFNRKLRYNYSKYTEDPDALEKFGKILPRGYDRRR